MTSTRLSTIAPVACTTPRSEEHTSELQSLAYLVCRLLLEKKKNTYELQSLAYLPCRLLRAKPDSPRASARLTPWAVSAVSERRERSRCQQHVPLTSVCLRD